MSFFITQVEGWQFLTNKWFPQIPAISRISFDAVNFITTWGIKKTNPKYPLYYVNDDYTLEEVTALDGAWQQDSSPQDATNPFRILFAYNTVTKTIILREGTPASTPIDPELEANEILIGYRTEIQQGGVYIPEPPQSQLCREITASGSFQIDWTFQSNIINLAGNITSVTDLYLKKGQFTMVNIRPNGFTLAGLPAYYYQTDGSGIYSSSKTTMKLALDCLNDVSGSEEVEYSYDSR